MTKPQVVVAPVAISKLSAEAPEFYPSGYTSNHSVSIKLFCLSISFSKQIKQVVYIVGRKVFGFQAF